jgi:cytidylate kinase
MAVITISRQFGAGGVTIGKMLANTLGYTFVDQEIIAMVSEKAKVSREWVQAIEKEAGSKLQQFISRLMPKGLVDRVLDLQRGYIDEDIYLGLLRQIITKIADSGNCIILGRGGQFILKDRKDTFHILLIADKAYRIRFMENQYKLPRQQAENVVNAEEKRRINLYRKFDKSDYDQPYHYHLSINMNRVTLETAVNLIRRLATGGP